LSRFQLACHEAFLLIKGFRQDHSRCSRFQGVHVVRQRYDFFAA
jgi:hypothetical protein